MTKTVLVKKFKIFCKFIVLPADSALLSTITFKSHFSLSNNFYITHLMRNLEPQITSLNFDYLDL